MKDESKSARDFMAGHTKGNLQHADGFEKLLKTGAAVAGGMRLTTLLDSPKRHLDPAPVHNPAGLGLAIREHRKRRQWNQDQLAKQSGVGVRFISELENGKATAELAKVFHVLNALDLTLKLESR